MMRRIYEKRTWAIACFGLLVLALAMTGCNGGGNGDAQAQPAWKVVTFNYDASTFVLSQATTIPTIQVIDGTTTYTLQSVARVDFIETDATVRGINMSAGDMVFERPATGWLTLICLGCAI
jgi:hypothetical protein